MLSPIEAAALARGQALKRYVRAAAALNDLYDDVALAEKVGVQRGAVSGWWSGARPSPDTLGRLAMATGLSTDELTRFVYYDGPPPALPVHPDSPAMSGVREGLRRDESHPEDEAPPPTSGSPERRPHGSGAGR